MNNQDAVKELPEDERNSTVAVYDRNDAADAAVRSLKDAGVNPDKLAVIGRGVHTENKVVGFYNSAKEIRHWGGYGALWGGLWGWLVFGLFWVPGVGSITAAGWIVWNLAAAASGAVIGGGVGAIAAALKSVGVPDDVIPEYESALEADQYLVIVHGTPAEVEDARQILDGTTATRLDTHTRSNAATTS